MRCIIVRLFTKPSPQTRSILCLHSTTRQFASRATSRRKFKAASIADAPLPPTLSPIQLRSYQEECIAAVLKHVDEGHRRMGVSLATGSGKTIIFTQLISRLNHPSRPLEATRTLILAHRTELVQQACLHCRRTYPDATIEIEMGNSHSSGMADITIASVASLVSKNRVGKFDPKMFKLILIDEAHHAIAASYRQTLDHFGVLDMHEGSHEDKPVVVGVSATLSRSDGLALGKVLDHIVYHRGYVEMIEESWLSPVKFTTVKTNVDLSRVRTGGKGGDFQIGELGRVVNTDQANEITIRSWLSKARTRKSTLVFCVDIAHVNEITAKFRQYGVDAKPVTSHTTPEDRKQRLEEFRTGKFPVLVNCGVFTEGTDIPNIDCVLLARPTRSKNLLVQMIGRGMRLHSTKEDCLVIDMVGNVERGVITVPTLLGLDPDEMLDGETLEEAKARVEQRENDNQNNDNPLNTSISTPGQVPTTTKTPIVTFTDYDNIGDLLADSRQDLHIRTISRLSWVSITPSLFILSLRSGFLKIHRTEVTPGSQTPPTTFSVSETQSLPPELQSEKNKHLKMRPRILVSDVDSLETAVNAADTYALSKYPATLLVHNAAWRNGPASEGQVKMLMKYIGKEEAEAFTKGRAGI
ncbi:P-loop containing nucleoside triphosphate hydrolase protein [Trichophaea hybrida]|nr:P-loop containing nucleoside triphosphate hydrolase protein [Trichophaea hybrida]